MNPFAVPAMSRASRSPPPMPSRKKGPKDSRSSGCTHQKMTRLYDKYGAYKCSICDKPPSFGWLYRCTQDSNGFLPESDFISFTRRDKSKRHMDPSLHNLSPSVVRAIGQGEYTDEQINLLVQQKEAVRLSILGHETRPTTASSSSAGSSNFSDLPESTTFSSNTSATTVDEEIRAAYDWAELQKAWQSEPVHTPGHRTAMEMEREEGLQSIEPPEITPCSFKICATCRPTYRERAYQSIDQVLRNPVMPPKWELDNRRVSDARIVAQLGLRNPERYYAQSSPSEISSQASSQRPDQDDEDGQAQNEDMPNDHSLRRRSGFRETVRNALKRASRDPMFFDQPGSDRARIDPNADSPALSRSMLFLRRKSKSKATPNLVDSRASLIGNTSLNDSLMLMLGSNTPLPQGPRTPQLSTFGSASGDPSTITKTSSTPDEIIAHI